VSGAVGVIPTDTVYGVVCRAADQAAVERLYTVVKPREQKPGTVVAHSFNQLVELGLKMRYLKAVEQWWPGPLSVIIPCDDKLAYLHRGLRGLAVRIPDNKRLQELLEKTGPLLTSSANLPGQPTAHTVAEAKAYFGDNVDFYEDGGDLSDHQPSTVVRIIDDAIEVLRPGAVEIDEAGHITTE
jgi:L-threonylcarbamoyladenylate synthase